MRQLKKFVKTSKRGLKVFKGFIKLKRHHIAKNQHITKTVNLEEKFKNFKSNPRANTEMTGGDYVRLDLETRQLTQLLN